ncbi:sigma-54 dependent transcriptional regulator [Myroides sp. DF42-4-2]|uniref:sigma-54-dependent transcriptional regulator n=1 Tax=unclassified Myroides TaxID=2642485 RepID=UPI0025776876|nr:sigma-54 dependent transcriptional regulator [Myroides sp. DF42-4-2]MDM1408398.1 sigma-54-dependent Fis family transcriptional regulator [Myroides sp. DF42-4-2]
MSKESKILIVEDEAAIRRVLIRILEEESPEYKVDGAEDGAEGLQMIAQGEYDLVISDIKMPKMSGDELLVEAKKVKPETVFVMISGHGDLETAINTMKLGAFDYISKPPDLNRLLTTVRNALDKSKLVVENTILKKKVSKKYEIIGQSDAIQQITAMIEKVAPTEARVLITGPNGTGKELVAHQIHAQSQRSSKPLIEVNCAAIPAELIESELFGHVKGAFTSAVKDRPGKFELADKGTIFLDEIGDMSLSAQAKVLRALQENVITRVGAEKDQKIDVRVLAATNKDLRKEIEAGRFREDLYHRLAVILIKVPALNDRRDDIPLLLEHFVRQIANEQGNAPKKFTPEAIAQLQQYDWSGNIRELRNVIERLIILGEKEVTLEDVKLFATK